MAIAAISTSPVGSDGSSVSSYVAEALRVLERRAPELGLHYELGSMFTTIEGPTDALFQVMQEMHEALFDAGAPRVGTFIKIDDRRDKEASMATKLESVRAKLNYDETRRS